MLSYKERFNDFRSLYVFVSITVSLPISDSFTQPCSSSYASVSDVLPCSTLKHRQYIQLSHMHAGVNTSLIQDEHYLIPISVSDSVT